MKKAYYIDTFSTQHLHEMYNASSLKMFASMYDTIEYRTSRSSLEHVKHLLGGLPSNVHASTIPTIHAYSRDGKYSPRKAIFKQLFALIYNTYSICRAKKGTDIIINYNTAMSLPFVNWASRITGKRVLQVCHGEMADLATGHNPNFFARKGMEIFKDENFKIADNLYFAVLGESIKRNLKDYLSSQAYSKLLSFDHSAIFDRIPLVEHIKNDKLVIGVIGAMRESKGLDSLFSLANRLKDNPNVEIRIIGRKVGNLQRYLDAGIVFPNGVGDAFLTREEMYRHIRQLDYVLYLFPPDLYRFTASGSLFDAIDAKRPIIALKNDFFLGVFETCGEFGYLESTEDALYKQILILAEENRNVFGGKEFSMSYIKKQLLPESVAIRFSSQWK